MKGRNHFADLELEVRKYLADPERRTKVLDDLAKTILSDLVKIKRPASANSTFIGASVPLLFSEGMIKGVASVIDEELGRHGEERLAPKTGGD